MRTGLNGTGFEEAIFLERVLGIIASHDPKLPLYIYYPMHLVHSPLCVPEGYIERFDFIRDADDNINHDRQCKPTRPLPLRFLLTRLKELRACRCGCDGELLG